VIDLRALPLPTEIKAKGRNQVGYRSFELGGNVASVVGLYEPTFIEDGWHNDIDHAHTDETSANRYFSKDGLVVSMSVSSLGESTMITFVNHGNLDLGTLPQTADAQPLYQFPGSLGYLSPSTVNDVAEFTRQELAAQGWREYTMPDTAAAESADSQSLVFIQNGLELSAFVSVAPAQGDKTIVQYNITLLPLDLPVYDEAHSLEFRRNPPYLAYKTAAGIDTLTTFYRAEMSTLGWTELREPASVTPEPAVLFFKGQKFYANAPEELTVKLELGLVAGQTEVTLQQGSAE
jgi:hypothetical protein